MNSPGFLYALLLILYPATTELSEAFLEDVGRIQTPVGLKQPSSIQTQILVSREQGVPLAHDVMPVLTAETFVFTMPDFIEGL